MTEHILKMNKGDLALVITQNDGWFQKISVAYADDPALDPLDINPNWLSLYKAITHLSLISDTYLRTRQSIMQESNEDIFTEWQDEDSIDKLFMEPQHIKELLQNFGYPVPSELEEDIEEIKKQDEEELQRQKGAKVIPLFPENN